MHLTIGTARGRLLVTGVSLLAAAGITIGVLASASGPSRPAASARSSASASSAPASSGPARSQLVVPLLGGSADAERAVRAVASASPGSAPPKVAPVGALRSPALVVVAPFSLSARVQSAVSGLPGVTGADPVEAARVKVNGTQQAVLGVNPSTFRRYAAGPTAKSDTLWQGVAGGGVAVSYTMGVLDKLSLGHSITVSGRQAEQLPLVAFGTVGIGGVDAVVSDSVARSLGVPAANAMIISAPSASVPGLITRIKTLLPHGASVQSLVTVSAGSSQAGVAASGAAGQTMSVAELTTALQAAESRQGLPYVWGAEGPGSFDCSGLVQWSFGRAGVSMPRVAADQARTGPAVPVSQLEPGDLLFYRTDPTAPGYISHVAIYLGQGQMIQAPEPGENVEVVPASFGSEFAGAVRVYPGIASSAAGGVA
jgi:cell wall-associated NlpC family hydrolase